MERPKNFPYNYNDTSEMYWNLVASSMQKNAQKCTKKDHLKFTLVSDIEDDSLLASFYPNDPKSRTKENCYLLGFKGKLPEDAMKKVLKALNPEFLAMYGNHSCSICFAGIDLPLKLLRSIPFIEYIERDCEISASQIQKNPPWNLDRLDQLSLPLDSSYKFERTGRGVNVYVIDSGIDERHSGKKKISANCIEFGGRAQLIKSFLKDPSDCAGHGTQVASIIAGTNIGVAKLANIRAIKILDCKGSGKNAHLIGAVYWIIQHHVKPAVINMSVGGIASKAIDKAVEDAYKAGILVVTAAGNNNADACYVSPSGSPLSLNVGSVDSMDRKAEFSNWGSCVDILAPGTDIIAALPGKKGTTRKSNRAKYTFSSGTSLSAPLVTGIAAQILEWNPQLTPDYLKSVIFESSAINVLNKNTLNGTINRILQQPAQIGTSGVKIKTKQVKVGSTFDYSEFDDNSSSSGHCKTWVWIFVPFMIALGVCLIIIAIWWLWRRRRGAAREQVARTNPT